MKARLRCACALSKTHVLHAVCLQGTYGLCRRVGRAAMRAGAKAVPRSRTDLQDHIASRHLTGPTRQWWEVKVKLTAAGYVLSSSLLLEFANDAGMPCSLTRCELLACGQRSKRSKSRRRPKTTPSQLEPDSIEWIGKASFRAAGSTVGTYFPPHFLAETSLWEK